MYKRIIHQLWNRSLTTTTAAALPHPPINYRVTQSPNKGNTLVATESIKQNGIVLTDVPICIHNNQYDPYELIHNRCNYCLYGTYKYNNNNGPVTVDGTYYCNQSCFDNNRLLHKLQHTGIDQSITYSKYELMCESLCLQYINSVFKQSPNNVWQQLKSLCYVNISVDDNIQCKYNILCNKLSIQYHQSITIIQQIVPISLYIHILGVLHINTFALYNKSINQSDALHIGSALYNIASYINHSCQPNIQLIYPIQQYSRITAFTALTNIDINEELCVTYCDITMNVVERRGYLRHYYGFDCMCSKCMNELNM